MSRVLLIKNANLYDPEPQGLRDILVVDEKVLTVAEHIDTPELPVPVEVVSAEGKTVIPGYVDQHVHMIGGGGEAGPYSRTPEVMLSDVTTAGVTTVIGVLGTDGTGRHPESLLAKVRGLETEGISAYMLTASYEIPLRTMTGDARRDIILIDKVLGIGEIALSDHRSSQPTKDEVKRILTQARLGGMLSAKAGVVQFHMGIGKNGIQMLFEILDETEIPARHMIPTHVNRAPHLFEQAKELARRGGYIDITSGIREEDGFTNCIKPSEAIRICMEEGVPMEQITMSSDGNGSMSVPLPDGGARLLVTRLSSLHEEVRDAVFSGVPIEKAIQICGANPARANGLYPKKGCIRPGSDADILFLDEEFLVDTVFARGRKMVEHGKALVKGTFETN
ncbi:beta-aspartyl-peptidase [Clostridium sp. OM02-18AC]|uniref:beta-aspartyl-peptidase n=1 Tax=Clostridium sp. OM02-18AC TaxID=2292311 RepID=UPI000E4EF298|nr:beta-aspartyl-peptidase [Clostridium sp. OM02-18AC]RHV68405.1 beta-aspartyl-peptidase [Clostridium sp. OM02-18AC]